ncbi:cell division control protein [Thecamonas trahens ATCC 50062]|uniref:Cell division control protein n=1 Tax=Thecamonas trahens ATCC 50062 TaxID=461836 RepID=A0A0L0DBQ9_THETB|nr:cell division control protein [Thecamonas trahens ATCC 50062]KNC49777.1 cell division control protein [Thecamonas trahens ATCC 50062]|eukprot:XP_013757561.1 cell division control protein [Thecamonas trahens ATCC 50062]
MTDECSLCHKPLLAEEEPVTVGSGARLRILHPSCFDWLKAEKQRRATSVASDGPSTVTAGQASATGAAARATTLPPARRDGSVTAGASELETVVAASVRGTWCGKSAGGGYSENTFSNNPQFVLRLPQSNSVEPLPITLRLTQCGPVAASAPHAVGIQVCSRGGGWVSNVSQDDFLQISLTRATVASRSCSLPPQTYTLVPHTLKAGEEGSFKLEVLVSEHLAGDVCLEPWSSPLAAEFPHVVEVESGWFGSSAGGSINDLTCSRNPQWFVRVSEAAEGAAIAPVAVALELDQGSVPSAEVRLRHIGLHVLDLNGGRFNNSVLLKKDILGSSGDYARLRMVSWRGFLTPRSAAYTVLPSTFEPKDEAPFTLRFYSSAPIEVVAAPEYSGGQAEYGNCVKVTSAWEGITAGGCLNYETALNNPMFFVSSGSVTGYTLELTLRQLPGVLESESADAPLHHIGLSVGRSFEDIRRGQAIADSGSFVNAAAVSVSAVVPPGEGPVCVVVATFNPGEERAFELAVESDALLQVVPSVLECDASYTAVTSASAAWRADEGAAPGEGPISYFDNPQFALSLTEPATDVFICLAQRPAPGQHYLEQAIILADANGERLIHNGFACVADSGDYLPHREVTLAVKGLEPRATPFTIMPTNMTPGVATEFTLVVRSSAPVELVPLPLPSATEVRSKLISDLTAEEKQVAAMTSISTRVDVLDSVDDRVAQRAQFEQLGLTSTLERISSVFELDDEMKAMVEEYNDEMAADNNDVSAREHAKKLAELDPLWSVKLALPYLASEELASPREDGPEVGTPVATRNDDGTYTMTLDSRVPVWSLVAYVLDALPHPGGLTAASLSLFVPTPGQPGAELVCLNEHDTLSMYVEVYVAELTLTLGARMVPIELALGAGVSRTLELPADLTAASAIAAAASTFGFRAVEMGLLLVDAAEAEATADGAGASAPVSGAARRLAARRGRYTSFTATQTVSSSAAAAAAGGGSSGGGTGEAAETWLEPDALIGQACEAKASLMLARQPVSMHVAVHFFEIIDVRVEVSFAARVRELKSRVMAAPELANHIVPSLFRTHGLFVDGADGKPRALDSELTLSAAGLEPGDKLSLRLKTEGGDEESSGASSAASEDADEVAVWAEVGRSETNWREEVVDGELVLSAASLNQLVLKLTDLDGDLAFQETFLLTYESFTDASTVMDKLVERFRVPPQSSLPQYAALSEAMFENTVVIPIRHQVLSIVIGWAQYFSKYMAPEDKAQLETTAFAVDPKRSMTSFVVNCLGLHERDAQAEQAQAAADKVLLRVKVGAKSKVLSFDGGMLVGEGKALVARKFELPPEPGLEDYQFSSYKLGVLDESIYFRDVGLTNLEEVFFKEGALAVGELAIPPEEQILLRVTLESGSSKVIAFGRNVAVAEMISLILFKFGLEEPAEAYELFCDEYGVMDGEQTLLSYALKNKSVVQLRQAGSSSDGAKSSANSAAIISVVCDDKARRQFVFPASTTVSSALNHIGVSFGVLELDKYVLKCVAYGRLEGAETMGSYALPPRSEVYFTRRNLTDGTSETLNYTLIRPSVVPAPDKVPKPKVPKRAARNLTIWDIDESEAARQLTLMDHAAYALIEPIELLNQAWTKEKYAYRCANLLAFIHRFNRISSWVAQTILAETKVRKRAQVMKWHVKLCAELRKLNNFHAVMAVLGGLSNPAVSRLKWTKGRLGRGTNKSLESLESLMSMEMGYTAYRTALQNSERAVPYIGVFLGDLIFIEDGNPDLIDGLVHWSKFRMMRNAIAEIRSFQSKPYAFVPVEPLQRYLNRIPLVGEKELYATSLELEPRGADRSDIE